MISGATSTGPPAHHRAAAPDPPSARCGSRAAEAGPVRRRLVDRVRRRHVRVELGDRVDRPEDRRIRSSSRVPSSRHRGPPGARPGRVVGATASWANPENTTRPIFVSPSCPSTNDRTAACAALNRFGSDVGRAHRPRDVQGEDDRRARGRHLGPHRRPRARQPPTAPGAQHQGDRHVPPPRRATRHPRSSAARRWRSAPPADADAAAATRRRRAAPARTSEHQQQRRQPERHVRSPAPAAAPTPSPRRAAAAHRAPPATT